MKLFVIFVVTVLVLILWLASISVNSGGAKELSKEDQQRFEQLGLDTFEESDFERVFGRASKGVDPDKPFDADTAALMAFEYLQRRDYFKGVSYSAVNWNELPPVDGYVYRVQLYDSTETHRVFVNKRFEFIIVRVEE